MVTHRAVVGFCSSTLCKVRSGTSVDARTVFVQSRRDHNTFSAVRESTNHYQLPPFQLPSPSSVSVSPLTTTTHSQGILFSLTTRPSNDIFPAPFRLAFLTDTYFCLLRSFPKSSAYSSPFSKNRCSKDAQSRVVSFSCCDQTLPSSSKHHP